jgi:tetratricopeptide (TPR) repeat protein
MFRQMAEPTCARCGREWQPPEVPGVSRKYCPRCWTEREERSHRTIFVVYAIFGALAAIALVRDPSPGFGWFAVNLVILHFCNFPAVVLHELGHAVAARLVRWPVYQVAIGWFGKPIFRRKVSGVLVQINSVPVGGFTYTGPSGERVSRGAAFLVYGGGPAMNAIAAVLLLPTVLNPTSSMEEGLLLGTMFFWANIICLGISLYPMACSTPYGPADTDGTVLWKTIFHWPTLERSLLSNGRYMEALALRESGQLPEALELLEKSTPESPPLRLAWNVLRAILQMDSGSPAKARELFLAFIKEQQTQDRSIEAILKNNLAWANLLIGDPVLHEESLAATEQAVRDLPSMALVKGTRGSILIQVGRAAEGVPLVLESFYSKESTTARDKAANACLLAMGEAQLGKMKEAQEWLRMAEELDSGSPLIERASLAVQRQIG